ncbi:hypothetical protein ACET3Z_008783 [Daucus carota]
MGSENGRRRCGRKKTKSNEGKIPQRGMGVAQLEWHMNHQGSVGASKKETNPNTSHNPNMAHSYAPQTPPYYPSYFTDQAAAAAASRSLGSGTLNQQQGLVVQRLGPNGLILGPGQTSGFGYVYPDQFPVLDQYGVGPANSFYQPNTPGTVNVSPEMSKDMVSYVPTIQCCPAGVLPKKKRYNGEISESIEVSGEMTGKDSYASFNGSSIISAGNYMTNYPGQSQDFGTKLSMNHTFPGPKIEPQDVGTIQDCKANGRSMRGGRNTLMEYEFFPEKEKGSIFKDWIKLGSESSSVAAAGGGYGETNSCLSTTNTSAGIAGASSSSIDLSLKLSY